LLLLNARHLFYLIILIFSIMNIYVSNLSFNTSDAELQDLFSQFGEVSSAKVITDRETGRSRGFGFVEMASDEEGKAAMSGLNNKEVEGRAMSVSVAKEREARTGGGGFGGGRSGGGGGYSSNRGGGNSRW
jgi:RNA recognition motif-containing protein